MRRNYMNPQAEQVYRSYLEDLSRLPFCFTYGGRDYHGFSEAYFRVLDTRTVADGAKESTTVVMSLDGALQITLLLTHYATHGVTEWTVWFENVALENSAILERVRSEVVFEGAYPNVKGIYGDHINQYRPYYFDPTDQVLEFTSHTGQTSHNYFPYFNLEYGDGGAMLAIGWAGTWETKFTSDGERTVWTASAVNGLHLYLKPGEKIRTALFVVAPYTKRNGYFATNYWRDWFVTYNLPRADAKGTALEPFSTVWLELDTGKEHSDGSIAEDHTTWRPSMEKLLAEDLHFDYRWLDAGWYIAPDGHSALPHKEGHDWWHTVGTWEVDPAKWPKDSLRESTDFARAHGMKTLVWFEPERVTYVDDLVKNYGYDPAWAIALEGHHGVSNNIGDPACRAWTTERICNMIRKNGVDMYREDHNFRSAYLWRYLDTLEGDDRRGITELHVIEGHYKMWDDIIACTLSLGGCGFVDSCASGGGRNDLESLRRGVPLLRSDSDRCAISHRLSMTTAFCNWIPFNGVSGIEDNRSRDAFALAAADLYSARASYLPALNISKLRPTQDPDTDFEFYRKVMGEWARVSPYLLKEFYVLTPWHREIDRTRHGGVDTVDYTVFCYFDPEREKGVLFGFREDECAKDTFTLRLPFAAGDKYLLRDEDSGEEIVYDGETVLYFDSPRTSRMIWVEKQ